MNLTTVMKQNTLLRILGEYVYLKTYFTQSLYSITQLD